MDKILLVYQGNKKREYQHAQKTVDEERTPVTLVKTNNFSVQ